MLVDDNGRERPSQRIFTTLLMTKTRPLLFPDVESDIHGHDTRVCVSLSDVFNSVEIVMLSTCLLRSRMSEQQDCVEDEIYNIYRTTCK